MSYFTIFVNLRQTVLFECALPYLGFPDSSAGKESTCNAGDPSWIPRLGRSAGERIGYPLQYSWASLVAQLVKNLPAMQETWARSPGWEDPLEKGKATHSSILAWRIPCPWGHKESDMTRQLSLSLSCKWIRKKIIITFRERDITIVHCDTQLRVAFILSIV